MDKDIDPRIMAAVKKMTYRPLDHGIQLINEKEIERNIGTDAQVKRFHEEVNRLLSNPKESPFIQLQKWRKLGMQMYKILKSNTECTKMSERQYNELTKAVGSNANKRWSEDDDELLINLVCDNNMTLLEIASVFGRSVSSIQSRVSYLVGIRRLSSEIAGNFMGTLNGTNIEGNIRGKLVKETK